MVRAARWLLVAGLVVAGCEGSVPGGDAGAEVDAGEPGDAGEISSDGLAADAADATEVLEDAAADSSDAADAAEATDAADVEAETDGPEPECTTANVAWRCEDADPCTTDTCEDGACVHTPKLACCLEDADCDDGVACTLDECNLFQRVCEHPFEDNTCCLSAADCDDFDPCTTDLCAANRCVHPRDACPCTTTLSCSDDNACSAEACVGGACSYGPAVGPDADEGCCVVDADCDDGDAQTYDGCQAGRCWHGPAACADDGDCQSPWACTAGQCQGGACVFGAPWEACCTSAADCDDGVAGTDDACVAGQCVHEPGATTPCTSDVDCPTPGLCASVSCREVAGRCSVELDSSDGCCAQAVDCGPAAPCTAWTCAGFVCSSAAAAGDALIWSDTFDDGALDGWTITPASAPAYWQLGQAQATSLPWSLYYGALPQLNFDVGTTAGVATSPLLTAPDGAINLRLRFAYRADIEPLASRDLFGVSAEPEGQAAVKVWDKLDDGGPGTTWKQALVSLAPLPAGSFRLSFAFDSVDGIKNDGEGIYIDDVEVLRSCPTP